MSDTDTKTEDTKVEAAPKETVEERKDRLEAEKQAAVELKERQEAEAEQAKQDEIDIETFWSFHRGDLLIRTNGSVDMAVARAEYEARKAEKEDSAKES
jgi:hypothetical protein